ncbi:putative DNA primase/helicase [Bradyrhizobium japonicum]|nr:toprim domain-containing protein [Bradyrhizobium liaoningense]MBR1002604.1 toprim domain-containing protein [Bradyrhizobium liaoningense]MBR1033720.1 toprim domain-containing protein [Bradyrhizobium liaoningense]MBR1069023.1 toprim domain-containing protein [Bradyrhizobium liaoningense]
MSQSLKSIAHALGGDAVGNRYVLCPGPGHSRRDRSLKVRFKSDGTFTVTSFAGDDWRTCKDFIRDKLGLPNDWHRQPDREPVIHLREVRDDEPARIRGALQRWAHAAPITGTLAEKYLASRGLTYSGDAVRFRENDRTMVALMTDIVTNEPCGVHCTQLDRDGRKIERRMRGRAAGAVVRLSGDTDVQHGLGIGEGIETCLATGFTPIWACLSAGTMAAFPVLGGIECLTVFADNDPSGTGIEAAKTCAGRWHVADREAIIRIPVEVGVDYATRKEVA